MESTMGVLTTRKSGREVHRQWPDEVKAQIVSESLRPGALANEVVKPHGLKPNHLSTWRTMARRGKLVLSAPEDAVEFSAVIVDPPVSEPPVKASRPEIVWRCYNPSGRMRVSHPDRCCCTCLRCSSMIVPWNRVRIIVATNRSISARS